MTVAALMLNRTVVHTQDLSARLSIPAKPLHGAAGHPGCTEGSPGGVAEVAAMRGHDIGGATPGVASPRRADDPEHEPRAATVAGAEATRCGSGLHLVQVLPSSPGAGTEPEVPRGHAQALLHRAVGAVGTVAPDVPVSTATVQAAWALRWDPMPPTPGCSSSDPAGPDARSAVGGASARPCDHPRLVPGGGAAEVGRLPTVHAIDAPGAGGRRQFC